MEIALNVLISAAAISISLWIAKTNSNLGGFIVSLPISTLIFLVLHRLQGIDGQSSTALAKSIFVAVPTSLLFFVPFLFAERLRISFWVCYFSGVLLLGVSYIIHKKITATWFT